MGPVTLFFFFYIIKNMRLSNIVLSAFASLPAFSLAATTASSSSSSAITINGNAFFQNNQRFYIRGVDYQPGGSSNLTDPLADPDVCKRDIAVFKDLGINTVRVYTVDNTADHSECMKLLQDAGMYLVLDVNTPNAAISRDFPACSYNADYLQSVFATIDSFAKFDNVLGFFAGNEVVNSENTTRTATYVKAVVRDMKKYMKARKYRAIPVGYSAADVSSNRQLIAQYMNCGDDADARIDMLGINDYSWCGPANFKTSGWSEKMQMYQGYSVPIFLSEFGCNKVVSSRPFTEIQTLYSTQMSSLFSGGLVYEYSQEANKYGLVQINDDDTITKLTDYNNLKSQYAKAQNPTGDGGFSKNSKYSTCPSYQANVWEANNTLPDMPSDAETYFENGAGDGLGTDNETELMCDQAADTIDGYSFSIDDSTSSAMSSTSSAPSSSSSAKKTVTRKTTKTTKVAAHVTATAKNTTQNHTTVHNSTQNHTTALNNTAKHNTTTTHNSTKLQATHTTSHNSTKLIATHTTSNNSTKHNTVVAEHTTVTKKTQTKTSTLKGSKTTDAKSSTTDESSDAESATSSEETTSTSEKKKGKATSSEASESTTTKEKKKGKGKTTSSAASSSTTEKKKAKKTTSTADKKKKGKTTSSVVSSSSSVPSDSEEEEDSVATSVLSSSSSVFSSNSASSSTKKAKKAKKTSSTKEEKKKGKKTTTTSSDDEEDSDDEKKAKKEKRFVVENSGANLQAPFIFQIFNYIF